MGVPTGEEDDVWRAVYVRRSFLCRVTATLTQLKLTHESHEGCHQKGRKGLTS